MAYEWNICNMLLHVLYYKERHVIQCISCFEKTILKADESMKANLVFFVSINIKINILC